MPSPDTTQSIQISANQFRTQFKTVLMATTSSQYDVDVSYAPFILDQQSRVCIFVSTLAKHTQNLINHPHVSLMWIEDEQDASNLFARKRLTLKCSAITIARTSSEWDTLLLSFEERHGETIALLKTLQDFQLFRFEADTGVYVRGFGKADPIFGNNLQTNSYKL